VPNDILSLIAEVDAEPVPAPAPRSPLDLVAEVEQETTGPVSRPMTEADQGAYEEAARADSLRDLTTRYGGVGGRLLSLPVVREVRAGTSAGVKGIGQSYAQLAGSRWR
jgi:predicted flap endonuclease-1-like 5' DNA nuclease